MEQIYVGSEYMIVVLLTLLINKIRAKEKGLNKT